ncbi:MAG: IS1 family transposase [bacterium]
MRFQRQYPTKNQGSRTIYKCEDCLNHFSETKNTFLQNLKKPISLIWPVIKARIEGEGVNATARIFDISKNTLLDWETKFNALYKVLFIYTLVHEFMKLVTEGDEVYTKVNKNVPPDQSSGWTILLIDRASRFIWELSCGKKDRKLFMKVIKTLEKIINNTDDLSIFTDGERRYGNILFEICYEIIKNGKRGRPKKTLKKGVKARVKNKGSQAHKKGPKRPKYQSPWAEHPETDQQIENKDIHANHAEAFFSAFRRKCSAFRRRTNTYAKSAIGLQRILNVYWVIHNFIRVHFTTKKVPAVALGIIDEGLSINELFQIQMV